ncbi:MAG TPA: MBL fold metallo-hydrolase [Kofleriaceae bacterium]|nr:MBL fold metallo-hydrolase [Kofleriaceae bacterium]
MADRDDREHVRSAGLRKERSAASKQFEAGVFRNTAVTPLGVQGGALPMLGEWMFGGQQRRPPAALPIERPHAAWAATAETGLRATWLGHSTVLLELDGKRVLTDPVFGNRVSPVGFVGPRRFHPVPAALDELPAIDVVVLSHDHFDHLCKSTMRALARSGVPIVTALGVGAHLEKYGFAPSRITELDWHEAVEINGVRLLAQPAQHFSGRTLGGRNSTLWASWVIQTERRKVFFSGDTGLTREFETIGRTHGPFDLVMLEIGAYHPSWGTIHLGPENALEAFAMLGGGTLLPVHWGTFSLAFHAWNDPAETLLELANQRGARILTPRLGAAFEPERIDGPTPWWRVVVSRRDRARLAPALEAP